MKKQNGFIATSLLYSFFLGFITLFIAMITIYLQNRVYLNKLEDSSKNNIYIREMKKIVDLKDSSNYPLKVYIDSNLLEYSQYSDNIFKNDDGSECNFAKCENIYYDGTNYVLEGCSSC